ncbi:MAG TPA: putative glycoside hydrolase [Ktedonobacteraceae bacterium]|nr:putative glycoside hydrolase [Ktedonobacteraceae bacterium]
MLTNQRHISTKHSYSLLTTLLILVLTSGCSLFGDNTPTTPASTPIPKGTPISINVPVCHLSACTNFAPVTGVRPFNDTWQNVHTFLTFDYNVTSPATVAKNYDFVWGADPNHIYGYRLGNPNIMLSYYMAMNVDGGTFTDTDLGRKRRGIAEWKVMHPDWVLYKCDRTTPAYEYSTSSVPFDLTNPAVFDWQMQTYIQYASSSYYGKYDALAVDNVNMENMFGACGHYDANGQWVQLFSGDNVDPKWEQAVVNWLTKVQAALHALPNPLLLFANFSIGAAHLNNPFTQQALAHVDGVLDESGFTHYGEYRLSDDQWLQMVQYVQNIQQQNKPFFLINEFKSGSTITNDDREWVTASYLMCNQHLAQVYIANIQGYGSTYSYPEYNIQIGNPKGDMYQVQNVYWRDFTNGEVVVNPTSNPMSINTASITSATSFTDPYGQHVGQTFTLSAHSAKILMTH